MSLSQVNWEVTCCRLSADVTVVRSGEKTEAKSKSVSISCLSVGGGSHVAVWGVVECVWVLSWRSGRRGHRRKRLFSFQCTLSVHVDNVSFLTFGFVCVWQRGQSDVAIRGKQKRGFCAAFTTFSFTPSLGFPRTISPFTVSAPPHFSFSLFVVLSSLPHLCPFFYPCFS